MDAKALSDIHMFIRNEIGLDESSLVMNKYLADLDDTFFTQLKLNFPQLNDNEIKLCALIRMGLSNKEIAISRNITPASVKVTKNRLRKKMALDAGTNLSDVLQEIDAVAPAPLA